MMERKTAMNVFDRFCQAREFRKRLEASRARLYRTVFSWCHDPALADDLTQDTLAKALKNANQLREMSLMSGWLFAILVNSWRDHFRQYRDMDDLDTVDESNYAIETTPEDLHARTQVVARVRAGVARLPLGQRQVLTLVALEGFSYVEVAEILGIPVGTVMSRLCRARLALRKRLSALDPSLDAQRPKVWSVK